MTLLLCTGNIRLFFKVITDKGEPDKDMQEFLQTLDNKKVVLFKRWEQKLT